MEEKTDIHDYFDIVMEITNGMQDFRWTMRQVTHDDIATMYVKKRLKEAKEAPNLED